MKRLGTASAGNTLLYDGPGAIVGLNIITASAAVTECSIYDAGSASLGAEVVTMGDFSAATGWTAGAGWSIGSGVATHSSGTNALSQAAATVTSGSLYKVTYTVGKSGSLTGSVAMSLGGITGVTRSTKDTFTEYIRASATTALAFTPSNDFDGYIDDVSVKKIADANSLMINVLLATTSESKYTEFSDCLTMMNGALVVLAGSGATAQVFG